MKNFVLGLVFAVVACFGSSVLAGGAGGVVNQTNEVLLGWSSDAGLPDGGYFPIGPGTTVGGGGAAGVHDLDYVYIPSIGKWFKIDPWVTFPNLTPIVNVQTPVLTNTTYTVVDSEGTISFPRVKFLTYTPGLTAANPGWTPPNSTGIPLWLQHLCPMYGPVP